MHKVNRDDDVEQHVHRGIWITKGLNSSATGEDRHIFYLNDKTHVVPSLEEAENKINRHVDSDDA